MSKGFKKFPHDWRRRVFGELKGIRLSVWMYHWSRSGPDDTAKVTMYQLEQDLPYSYNRIVEARSWLHKNGWLGCVEATQRNEKGRWSVPTYKPVIPPEHDESIADPWQNDDRGMAEVTDDVNEKPRKIEPLKPTRKTLKVTEQVTVRVTEEPSTEKGVGDPTPKGGTAPYPEKVVGTVPRKAVTAKRGTTVDTSFPVDTVGSDATRLPVNTERVEEPARQPASMGCAVRLSNPDYTDDERSGAGYIAKILCKRIGVVDPQATEKLLPLVRGYDFEELCNVVHSPVIEKDFWLDDLSSVGQFIWRYRSEGEDSLRNQVRQEENKARKRRRLELEKKVEKNQASLTQSDQLFLIADFWFHLGHVTQTVFPDEVIFKPLLENAMVPQVPVCGIKRVVMWGYDANTEWMKENLFTSPDAFVENYPELQAAWEEAHPEEVEVVVKDIDVENL